MKHPDCPFSEGDKVRVKATGREGVIKGFGVAAKSIYWLADTRSIVIVQFPDGYVPTELDLDNWYYDDELEPIA